MKSSLLVRLLLAGAIAGVLYSCASAGKIEHLRNTNPSASLRLPNETSLEIPQIESDAEDVILTAPDGRQVRIMKATRDESTGEMVATDNLEAAFLVVHFRNVAERMGLVDIEFELVVGDSLLDKAWQLSFSPKMIVMQDTLSLDQVLITGEDFRKSQVRGYQQYDRFLQWIARDSTRFVDEEQLELFLQRNLPEVYAFKTDSSFVSDEQFESVFGVTQREALDHYTRKMVKQMNAWKIRTQQGMRRRLIKNPIVEDGVRVDTLYTSGDGDFAYVYRQTIRTRPGLRKVDVLLNGEIHDAKGFLFSIPDSEPLTFYISSLSTLADTQDHYKKIVISRNLCSTSSCNLAFEAGSAELQAEIGENALEIHKIDSILVALRLADGVQLDSILVTASCSPDGRYKTNATLSQRRSDSVSRFFGSKVKAKSANLPENWALLDSLVARDTLLSVKQKNDYYALARIKDPDRREEALRKLPFAQYVRENLYPQLRTVRFDFFMHRKGMVKDTVETSVVDSAYMRGVRALVDRDYERALEILEPYADYNTAVAYLSLGRNHNARHVLETLPRDARTYYMLALVYARQGMVREALENFMAACAEDPAYKHRGNLDPEIAAIIKCYDLDYSLPASFL